MDVESKDTLLAAEDHGTQDLHVLLDQVIAKALDRIETTTIPAATEAGRTLIQDVRQAVAGDMEPVVKIAFDLNAKFDRLLAVVETLKASIAINIGKTQ